MNPFQLGMPQTSAADALPLDDSRNSMRMMQLHEDLMGLAAGLDRSGWTHVMIVHTPDRLQVSSSIPEEGIAPILAQALLTELVRLIRVSEQVRARMPENWNGA